MPVYLRDGSAWIIARAATLRQKLQDKLVISACYSILMPGQPVLVLTKLHLALGRVAPRVPVVNALVRLCRGMRRLIPVSPALEVDC